MSSIIIAAVPVHGHVMPLLTVARCLVERGDRVRFLTGARFADAVRACGAEHITLPPEADFDDRQDLNTRFPERAALSGARAIAFDVEHVFVRPGRPQHDIVLATHHSEPADVVLTDPAFVGGAFLLGHPRELRPPVVMGGVLPLMISSRDTAPYGMGLLPRSGAVGRLRNRLLERLAARLFAPATVIADEMYRDLHGTGLPFPVLDWARGAEAIVQFTVPEFEYPRSDAPPGLHFAGPIPPSTPASTLPPWWPELDGSRPVVHVTQGTIANWDYRQIIAPTLEGLANEDVLVIVSTGGRPVSTLPSLPSNARAAEFLPYDQLLPRTDAFVTNGGYGGVQYAIRYGVPIVATSGHEDKPEVAARVAWSGVGRRLPTEAPSPAAVRRAVRTVLREPRYRQAAERLGRQMASTDGVGRVLEVLDALAAASTRGAPTPSADGAASV